MRSIVFIICIYITGITAFANAQMMPYSTFLNTDSTICQVDVVGVRTLREVNASQLLDTLTSRTLSRELKYKSLKSAIESGFDVNFSGWYSSPLEIAILFELGDESVKLLLEKGASVDLPTTSPTWELPLIFTCCNSKLSTGALSLKELLKYGANPNAYYGSNDQFVIHYVSANKNYRAMKQLVEYNVDVNYQRSGLGPWDNASGWTPLHYVANVTSPSQAKSAIRCAKLLISHGAYLKRDVKGRTPIDVLEENKPNLSRKLFLELKSLFNTNSQFNVLTCRIVNCSASTEYTQPCLMTMRTAWSPMQMDLAQRHPSTTVMAKR